MLLMLHPSPCLPRIGTDTLARLAVSIRRLRDDVQVDVGQQAEQAADHRAAGQLLPAGAVRVADDHLRDVLRAAILGQRLGDVAARAPRSSASRSTAYVNSRLTALSSSTLTA